MQKALFLLAASATILGQALSAGDRVKEDEAYWQVALGRAGKIVAKLDLEEAHKQRRVQEIIAGQYRDLKNLHDGRDEAITALKEAATESELSRETLVLECERDVAQLHYSYLARLAAELSPDQIDEVKDGMTYGVVTLTYARYRQLLPELEEEHFRYIYAALVEAREHAMDEGSSDEKHRRFGRYKGRINNYLSALGVNMKEQEMKLAERERAAAK